MFGLCAVISWGVITAFRMQSLTKALYCPLLKWATKLTYICYKEIRKLIFKGLYLLNIHHCLFVWKKCVVLFSKDALNWSKVTVKTFIMLQKFKLSFCSSRDLKRKKTASQLFSTLIMKKVSLAANQYIKWFQKGPCDAKNWNSSCWNSSFAIKFKYIFK